MLREGVLSEWLKSAAMGRRQIAAKAVAGKRWSLVTGRYRPILLKNSLDDFLRQKYATGAEI